MSERKYILNQESANQKLHRMALEIAENLSGSDADIILIGVRNSGTVIAEKIAAFLKPYVNNQVINITVSLDKDLPKEVILSENLNFTDLNIVLIDDVANSGKTLLYGLKPLMEYYPRTIQTLVLVERMHKLYPVKPDYVGLLIATTPEDHIQVEVFNGEVIGAYIG
jgi:pyrimidine operon attenuation protein / uracil phosphoribosyltransferase